MIKIKDETEAENIINDDEENQNTFIDTKEYSDDELFLNKLGTCKTALVYLTISAIALITIIVQNNYCVASMPCNTLSSFLSFHVYLKKRVTTYVVVFLYFYHFVLLNKIAIIF